MGDETSIDDLFADGEPKAAEKPRRERKPRATSKRKSVPPPPPDEGEPDARIDNAVNIRRLDWECECGNTNTLDLQMCGKCRKHRYTN